jgi:hypothetical protein
VYGSEYSSARYFEVSGKFLCAVTITPGKNPTIPIGWEAGWGRHNRSASRGEGKLLPLPGLELRPLGSPACGHSLCGPPLNSETKPD